MDSIAFICTANICRSPFAQSFFNKRVQELHLPFQAISAGTRSIPGSAIPEDIIAIAAEFDAAMHTHRSQPLQTADLNNCRLIIGMEQHHCDAVIRLDAALASKTYLLRQFAATGNKTRGIVDPFGLRPDFIRACYDDIAESIEGLISHLTRPGAV